MNFLKESVVSGSTQVAGFKVDGAFVATEPIPGYCCWDFQANSINGFESFRLDSPSFDVELVSLFAAQTRINTEFPIVQVDTITCETQNAGDPILVFKQDNLGVSPIQFNGGLIVPANSKVTIAVDSAVRFMRLIAKPVFCQFAGSLMP